MKCIKSTDKKGTVTRVTDEVAHEKVAAGKATYVPKQVWKQTVRDAEAG